MEKLPEDVMIEKILLKLPASSLVNLRCGRSAFKTATHNYACNFPIITTSTRAATVSIRPEIAEMHIPFESTEIRASCNGLLYLHQWLTSFEVDGSEIENFSYYIWNPCTKEYKELPPPPPPLLLLDDGVDANRDRRYDYSSGFCGFDYDRNNDEYKILHYENRVDNSYIVHADQQLIIPKLQSISSIIEFSLYTLGTNTWKRIAPSDNHAYRSFYFTESSKRVGFLVNGALHWSMSHSYHYPRPKVKIISFDIEKEVFREIQKPSYSEEEEEDYCCYSSLQTLQECLCMCQIHPRGGGGGGGDFKIDIWMLQDYDVMDSWTKLFRVVIPGGAYGDYDDFRLLRYCENGEIVIQRNAKEVIVYDPVNHKSRCAQKIKESIGNVNGNKWLYSMDYTESLVCLNSGTYTTTDNGIIKQHNIDIINTYINSYCNNIHMQEEDHNQIICFLNGEKKRKRKRTLTELAS